MKRAAILDDKTKNEMYINQVKLMKTKLFAKDIGLDAMEGLFGRNAEF